MSELNFLKLYSSIPNFKGKNFLGQKIFSSTFDRHKNATQNMLSGFQMNLNFADRMQRLIYIKKCHEPETETVFAELIHGARVFCDVGANIGYFSFLAKQLNSTLQVFSFEPLPQNISAFKENQKLNSFAQVNLTEACVSNQLGEVEFLIPPTGESGWGRIAHKSMFSGEKIKRQVLTLDQFYHSHQIEFCDVLKIDVEGYEYKVLQGAEQTINRFRPKICIELNEPCLLDTGTSSAEIFSYFKQKKYKLFSISSSGKMIPTDEPLSNYEYLNYVALPYECGFESI